MNHYIITFTQYEKSISKDMTLANICRLGQGEFINDELHVKTSMSDEDFRGYVKRFNDKPAPSQGGIVPVLDLDIYLLPPQGLSGEEEALEFLRSVFVR
jgi:hypothetical protein